MAKPDQQTSLSPKQLAQAIGVSESSLRRWTDEGRLTYTKTEGGHRRIPLSEAVRFIRDGSYNVVEPEILGVATGGEHENPATRPTDPSRVLTSLLIDGEMNQARSLIVAALKRGRSMHEICDELITPAMHTLGELWQHSDEGIYIEHRATAICLQAINECLGLMPAVADDAPVAIGGAPAGDPYLLPSMIASAVLAEHGWRAINLGADTPLDVLASAVTSNNASVVWVTVSGSKLPPTFENDFRRFVKQINTTDAELIVGGRSSEQLNARAFGSFVKLSSMTELAAYVKGMSSRQAKVPS